MKNIFEKVLFKYWKSLLLITIYKKIIPIIDIDRSGKNGPVNKVRRKEHKIQLKNIVSDFFDNI